MSTGTTGANLGATKHHWETRSCHPCLLCTRQGTTQQARMEILRCTTKHQCFINVILNSIKRYSKHSQVKYKFGVLVTGPKKLCGSINVRPTEWEHILGGCNLDQVFSYHSFRDLGVGDHLGSHSKCDLFSM